MNLKDLKDRLKKLLGENDIRLFMKNPDSDKSICKTTEEVTKTVNEIVNGKENEKEIEEESKLIKDMFDTKNMEKIRTVLYECIFNQNELLKLDDIYHMIKVKLDFRGICSDKLTENLVWNEDFFGWVILYVLKISDGSQQIKNLAKRLYDNSNTSLNDDEYYFCAEEILQERLISMNIIYRYNHVKLYYEQKEKVKNYIKAVSANINNYNEVIETIINTIIGFIKQKTYIVEKEFLNNVKIIISANIQYFGDIPGGEIEAILLLVLLKTDNLLGIEIK